VSQTERWKMQASSLTSRLKRRATVTDWAWWQPPPLLRWYVATPTLGAIAFISVAALHTDWRLDDLVKFLLLACCGMISNASTPRIAYTTSGGLTRDFSSVWVVPIAILLPPIYAALVPIPFGLIMQLYVYKGIVYRRVFTAAATGLSYAAASLAFRCFPPSFAGGAVGVGLHAFTWCLAVAICEIIGGRLHHFLILAAVKLSDPKVRIRHIEWNWEALQGLFVEIDLAVLITLAVGLSSALVVLALPTVLLVRRFLVHPLLIAQSRVDSKTGLLNVSTWEKEVEAELSRAARARQPLAVALVDIDHFKTVNDTYGHLVGDKVLKAVAEALTSQSRDYDRVGRFGGEEFVLLLAQTTQADACKIAERLRGHVEALTVPVDDRPDAPVVQVTISIGVTDVAKGEKHELTDLLAAADSALYCAKQAGRNCVAVATPQRNMGLDSFNAHVASHHVLDDQSTVPDARSASATQPPRVVQVHVQANPTALSLCQNRSLSVPIKPQHESNSLK
jgi:diguanylate cyclase (GGDEF)-like protein